MAMFEASAMGRRQAASKISSNQNPTTLPSRPAGNPAQAYRLGIWCCGLGWRCQGGSFGYGGSWVVASLCKNISAGGGGGRQVMTTMKDGAGGDGDGDEEEVAAAAEEGERGCKAGAGSGLPKVKRLLWLFLGCSPPPPFAPCSLCTTIAYAWPPLPPSLTSFLACGLQKSKPPTLSLSLLLTSLEAQAPLKRREPNIIDALSPLVKQNSFCFAFLILGCCVNVTGSRRETRQFLFCICNSWWWWC